MGMNSLLSLKNQCELSGAPMILGGTHTLAPCTCLFMYTKRLLIDSLLSLYHLGSFHEKSSVLLDNL